jgi:2,3,4,5-tetrahydropyridine-2-carboxylate N-succinyltransferase
MKELQEKINAAWENKALLDDQIYSDAIRETISLLDNGLVRVAEKDRENWVVNEWIKKAVLMYFPISQMVTIEAGPFEYHDKIRLKKDYSEKVSGWCLLLWQDMAVI